MPSVLLNIGFTRKNISTLIFQACAGTQTEMFGKAMAPVSPTAEENDIDGQGTSQSIWDWDSPKSVPKTLAVSFLPGYAAVSAWKGMLHLRMVWAWINTQQKTYHPGCNLENVPQNTRGVRGIPVNVAPCYITGHMLIDKATLRMLKKS